MPQQSTCIAVLDVGHGNSTVVVDNGHVVVIDAGLKTGLLEYLTTEKIKVIRSVVLSHADADHIGGLIGLLSSGKFEIHEVRLNPDSRKTSKIWDYLTYQLEQLNKQGTVRFFPSLTTNDNGTLDGPTIQVEILAPDPYLVAKGVGSTIRDGNRIETNTISAVIRLKSSDGPIVLLPGDIDDAGMDYLLTYNRTLASPILVFPHHGGRAGHSVNIQEFARKICAAVQPTNVIFSIDRDKSNLQPELIDAIRKYIPAVRIACTQLHHKCSNTTPSSAPTHLNSAFSVGRAKNRCCAGTMLIYWSSQRQVTPLIEAHQHFIIQNAPSALCGVHTKSDSSE